MIGSNPATLAFLAQAISGTAAMSGAYSQSEAVRAQAGFEKRAANTNAALADERAQDALQRGEKAAAEHLGRTRQLQGAQRAAYAAQGVDVSTGTPADIARDTAALGSQDAETIKRNSYREAWGHQVEAVNFRTRGKLAQIAGRGQARQTLLSGGMGLAKDLALGAYLYRREADSAAPATPQAPSYVPRGRYGPR